jgi:hypothetical protein
MRSNSVRRESGIARRRGPTAPVATRTAAIIGAALAVLAFAPTWASADAGNPSSTTQGTEVFNSDGTVTVNLSGTWNWPTQSCTQRYGIGWAVDWWGTGTNQAAPSFAVTNATEVLPAGPTSPTGPGPGPAGPGPGPAGPGPGGSSAWSSTVVGTGTQTAVGALQLGGTAPPPPPGSGPGSGPGTAATYFHVGQYYSGEDTNLCADATGSVGMAGTWTASATYPSAADVPAQLCVNMYDEHGQADKSSGNANDFSPLKDADNSIQTNDFQVTSQAYCLPSSELNSSGGTGGSTGGSSGGSSSGSTGGSSGGSSSGSTGGGFT